MDLDFDAERRKLVDHLISEGLLQNPALIQAFLRVKRELFVPSALAGSAYDDSPLPTMVGQTISAPHMVAIMNEELGLEGGLKLLEIGAGSGYHAAICAEIVACPDVTGRTGHVYTVENRSELVELAKMNLEKARLSDKVTVIEGDGSCGLPEYAPYDRILVTAAAPRIPESLREQLKAGGRIVIPIGPPYSIQRLMRVDRLSEGRFKEYADGDCVFVPLIGKCGFSE